MLLYLDQEGRGIAAKMRAYGYQRRPDTIDADAQLGFGADERRYGSAVAMLHAAAFRAWRCSATRPRHSACAMPASRYWTAFLSPARSPPRTSTTCAPGRSRRTSAGRGCADPGAVTQPTCPSARCGYRRAPLAPPDGARVTDISPRPLRPPTRGGRSRAAALAAGRRFRRPVCARPAAGGCGFFDLPGGAWVAALGLRGLHVAWLSHRRLVRTRWRLGAGAWACGET